MNTGTKTKMVKISRGELTSPLLDRSARLAARKRAFGIWKGKTDVMVKENRLVRKEWDNRVKKIGL